jgi:glutathione S-transferase
MKLYYSRNLNPRVCVAAARHLEAPVEYVFAMPRHPNHEEAFRAINPNTLVPVLAEEGRTLWETDAIVCRLAEITGSDFWRRDAAQPEMMMWISWASHHLTRAGDFFYWHRVVLPTFSDELADPGQEAAEMANFRKFAGILDQMLEGREWLVGDRLSYADFRVGTIFPFAGRAGLPIADYPNVAAFARRLDAIPAWHDPFRGLADQHG